MHLLQVKVEQALKPKVVDPKDIVLEVTGTSESRMHGTTPNLLVHTEPLLLTIY